jgi:hypothetical protein
MLDRNERENGERLMYEIAKYLTDEQKRRACEAEYRSISMYSLRRRDGNGCCPMGLATGGIAGAPVAYSVADAITNYSSPAWPLIESAARQFIYDWDDGKITDLYEALGVERVAQ